MIFKILFAIMRKENILVKLNTSDTKQIKPKKMLPLTSDIIFKAVFSRPGNEDVLKALLEAILDIEIKEVTVQNPELPVDFFDNKAGVIDIKVAINDDTVCGIEMQVKNLGDIDSRSTYYMSKTLSSEIKRGDDFKQVKKSIAINFLDFEFYQRNSYRSIAHMKFEKNKEEEYINLGYEKEDEIATKDLEMHFIEIPKFVKKLQKPRTKLEQWLYLIAGKEEMLEGIEERVKEIEKAVDTLEQLSMDKQAWNLYESRDMAKRDYNTGIRNAEERGLNKGIKKGEKKNSIEIARKMLKENMPESQIIRLTGLTENEINNLKDKIKEKAL